MRVDDETWAEFRRLLGDQSVAEALGAHVEAEVATWRRRQARRPELDEREVLEALARIEDAKATLDSAHAGRTLFVNMPVADLEGSKAFFATLGFSFHPGFTDETAACMLVGGRPR